MCSLRNSTAEQTVTFSGHVEAGRTKQKDVPQILSEFQTVGAAEAKKRERQR